MGVRGAMVREHLKSKGRISAYRFACALLGLDAFREEDHPRDEDGKFTSKGGGSGGEAGEGKSSNGTGLPNNPTFNGIRKKAKENPKDFNKFMSSLSADEMMSFMDQKQASGSDESDDEYMERMYRTILSEPHEAKKSDGVVQGRDMMKEGYRWDGKPYTEEKFGQVIDTEIEDVINKQGFNGVPKIVDKDEFDRIMKENPEMPVLFRSYAAPSAETLEQYDKMLESGEWYVDCGTGGAQYGQGMYAAGVFPSEVATLNDINSAFSNHGVDFLVDDKGQYWEMDTQQYMSEVDPDRWFDPGEVFLFAGLDSKGHLLELVNMEDEGYGLQWIDRTTGEMHDYGWVMEAGFTDMRECVPSTQEQAIKRDFRGAMEEMRHYRELNEERCAEHTDEEIRKKKREMKADADTAYEGDVYGGFLQYQGKEGKPKVVWTRDARDNENDVFYRIGENMGSISTREEFSKLKDGVYMLQYEAEGINEKNTHNASY